MTSPCRRYIINHDVIILHNAVILLNHDDIVLLHCVIIPHHDVIVLHHDVEIRHYDVIWHSPDLLCSKIWINYFSKFFNSTISESFFFCYFHDFVVKNHMFKLYMNYVITFKQNYISKFYNFWVSSCPFLFLSLDLTHIKEYDILFNELLIMRWNNNCNNITYWKA